MLNSIWRFAVTLAICFAVGVSEQLLDSPEEESGAVSDVLSLVINDRVTYWDTIAVFVMPGETLSLAVPTDLPSTGWVSNGGTLVESGAGRAEWIAPDEHGLHRLVAVCGSGVKQVNIFVMVPASRKENGRLNGFHIGRYPQSSPYPGFAKPDGFIEVTKDNLETPLSPNYKLGDFVPPYPSEYPKYIVLREELILKMELLTGLIREKGHDCTRLKVMSGYRTPARQNAQGAGRHSAHIYGGAADVFVDESGDGALDDLNGDGRSDSQDARLLASYVDELQQRYPELVGGVGWYRRTRSRTAFVHIDTRGERIRWGQ